MARSQKFSFTALALVALAVTSACTKSKELKNMVDPDAYVAKSDFQGKTFHLSRGVEEADSENTVDATPGMSEDYGLVQARITEDELQFISVFQPNGRPGTNKIVASYKISGQFDIKRDTNDYGNDTNKIVEDKTNGWADRAYMRVDWANPTNSLSKYSNSLGREQADSDDDNKSGKSENGISEENTTLLENPKIEKGHISFLVETSVKEAGKSGTFTFPMSEQINPAYRVVYRTHLMEVKASDFKPIPYTLTDFSRFGYFFTQQNFQDPRGILEKNQNLFANAHNVCEAGRAGSCATNQIRWVLSKDFPEIYKDTARKVVKEWNATFQKALNRTDDVVVLDEAVQATISDPTMNVLALYPERTQSGLLGVAQWVSDPRTGELNGVRATVYGDGIESVVASVDDKINMLVSDDPLKDVIGTTTFGAPLTYVSPFNDRAQASMIGANARALKRNVLQKKASTKASNTFQIDPSQTIARARTMMDRTPVAATMRAMTLASKVPTLLLPRDAALIADDAKTSNIQFPASFAGAAIPSLAGMESLMFSEVKTVSERAKTLHDAEHGTHGTDLVEDAAIRYLYSYLAKGATKQDLESNRQRIEDEIRKLTFYTTALHEMGHAFGLRHNFAGSADKAHYPQEYKVLAAKMDPKSSTYDPSVTKEDLAPYESSSIMDYTRDFFDQKNGLGDYDKAAIKYIYNRSINKEADPITQAHYSFCTDHQVGEDALCQRFDKGHNLTEMVQGDIDLYDHNYAMWHYRRGRVSQNNGYGWGSPRLLQSTLLSRVFLPIRQVMDEYLYSFIVAQPGSGTGLCSRLFIQKSIEAGEMLPVCTAADQAKAGVDMTDWSTLANALYQHDAQGNLVTDSDGNPIPLKPSSQYMPYGFADLVYSNTLATDFFQRVIGSPEPGVYMAIPTKDAGFRLAQIPEGADLAKIATQVVQQIPMNPALANDLMTNPENYTAEIKVGGYGRQYDTRQSVVGGWTRNDSLGSYYDKVAALNAIARPGEADKYSKDSMVANSYIFPQTRSWTSNLLMKVITGDRYLAAVPVKTKGGRTLKVTVPASTSLDLQVMTTVYALSLMTSETDKSIYNKLQICDANQAQCGQPGSQGGTVSFKSVDTGNTYSAFQSLDKDSIAYALVSAAKDTADDRLKYVAAQKNSGNVDEGAKMLMAKPETQALFDRIEKAVASDLQLAAYKFNPTLGWKEVLDSQWKNLQTVTEKFTQVDPSQASKALTTVQTAFSLLTDMSNTELTAMGPAGQCWLMKNHPEALADGDKPQITKEQLNARLEAKASGKPIPQSALTAVVPSCDPDKDAADGQIRYNLVLLLNDLKTMKTVYMDKMVQAQIDVLDAPSQIDSDTTDLRSQESTIGIIRKIMSNVNGD